ncbi:MAG: hypothetical protein D6776_09420, partial [Planctomycetota bacterium]
MTEQWSPQELEAVRRRLEGLRRNVVQAAAAEPDAENAESAPEIELPEAVTDGEPDAAAEEAAAVEALEPIVRAAEQADPAELGGILRRLAALARSADSPAVRRVARRRLRALVERWLRRLADGRVDPAADRAVVAALAVLGGTGLLPQGALASVLAPVEQEVAAARAGHDQPSDPRAAFADRLLARMHSNIRCATLAERAERFAEHATHEASVRFADAIEQRVTRSNLMALERFGQTLGIAESFTRFDRRFGMLDAVLGGALEQGGEGTLARALAAALGVDLALRGQGPAAARRWLAAMPQLVVALRASGAIAEEEGGVAAVAAGYEGPRPVDPTPARHPRLVGWPEMMEFHSERRPWYGFSEPARGWRGARVGYAGFEGGLGARTSHTSTFGALGALPRALTATAFSGFEPAPAHAQAVRTFGGMSHVALGYGGIAATRTQWQAGRELQRALGARARGGADLLVGAGAPDLPRLALAQLGLRSAPPAAASGGRWTDLSLDRFGLPRLRGSVRLPFAAMQASGGLDPLGSLVLQPGASPTSRRQAAVRRPLVLAPDAFGRLRLRSAEFGAPPAAVTVPSFVLEPAGAPGAPTLRRTNLLESLAVSGGTSMPGFRVPAPVAGRTAARWTRAVAPAAELSFTTWRTELQWLAPAAPLLSAAPAATSWAGPSPARALPTAAWRGLGVQPLASPRGFGVGHAGFAPSQLQPRIGGAGAAVFEPQQRGAGAPVSARGITVPAPLRKYYAPALRPGLALGATARFGLAGFGGGRAATEALGPRAQRLAAPTYDFAPPELARLTSGFGHDAIRAVAPVAPWQARPRQIAFDAAGFAPAARLGRTASFEIEAAGLAAPRWFRFGRTLDAVRSRYSGERLHAPHELHFPVGTRRVASGAPRIAAPRLEAVYGRRWRFDVPVGQGADALGLGAHGLE